MTPSSILGPDWFSASFLLSASALALPMNRFLGPGVGVSSDVILQEFPYREFPVFASTVSDSCDSSCLRSNLSLVGIEISKI
jgi:hypothetical protein